MLKEVVSLRKGTKAHPHRLYDTFTNNDVIPGGLFNFMGFKGLRLLSGNLSNVRPQRKFTVMSINPCYLTWFMPPSYMAVLSCAHAQ